MRFLLIICGKELLFYVLHFALSFYWLCIILRYSRWMRVNRTHFIHVLCYRTCWLLPTHWRYCTGYFKIIDIIWDMAIQVSTQMIIKANDIKSLNVEHNRIYVLKSEWVDFTNNFVSFYRFSICSLSDLWHGMRQVDSPTSVKHAAACLGQQSSAWLWFCWSFSRLVKRRYGPVVSHNLREKNHKVPKLGEVGGHFNNSIFSLPARLIHLPDGYHWDNAVHCTVSF